MLSFISNTHHSIFIFKKNHNILENRFLVKQLGLWGKQMVDGIQLKRLEDLKNTRFEIFGWRKGGATSDGGLAYNVKKNGKHT